MGIRKLALLLVFLTLVFVANYVFAAEGRIEIDDARNCAAGTGNITSPGSYFVSHDIDNTDSSNGACPASDAIIIDSDHVTIDMEGHAISVIGSFSGIKNINNHTDIEIKNGKIVTTSAGSVAGINFSSATGGEYRINGVTVLGFQTSGISVLGGSPCTDPVRVRAIVSGSNVRVDGATSASGIMVNCGESSRFEQNQVHRVAFGLVFQNTVDSLAVNNISNQNTGDGIRLDTCENVEVTDNVTTANGTAGVGSGVRLITANQSIVTRNDCSSNKGQGIWITGGKNNLISHNNASNNGGGFAGNGILLDTGANNNTLDWNLTSSNAGFGINFSAVVPTATANVFSYNRSVANLAGAYAAGVGNNNVTQYQNFVGAGCVPGPLVSTNQ